MVSMKVHFQVEKLTLWVRSVWTCESSVFGGHPGSKAVALVQGDGQHLSGDKILCLLQYGSRKLHCQANTHPCFKVHRKPVGHVDHLEALLYLLVELHFAEVFPFTRLTKSNTPSRLDKNNTSRGAKSRGAAPTFSTSQNATLLLVSLVRMCLLSFKMWHWIMLAPPASAKKKEKKKKATIKALSQPQN